MAQELSVRAQLLLDQIGKEPQIILQIEGIDLIFGARPILKFIRWDEDDIYWDQPGITWDGLVENSNSRSWISLEGSTKTIGQEIYPDKEGASSFSSANIQLIDKDGAVSSIFALDNIGEILGKRASFYYGFAKGAHPEDSIPVLRGVITDFYSEPGSVNITISHPESLKRQSVFSQYSGALTAAIDSITTTIPVDSTVRFIESQDLLTSYIRIDDEVMEVTGLTATTFTVVRSRFGSIAVAHDDETEIVSNYRLQGGPTILALKLMLSKEGNAYETSSYNIKQYLDQRVIVDSYDIGRESGITAGDTIDLGVDGIFTIASFDKLDTGDSFIVVDEPLTNNANPAITLSWKSKYNTLPNGLEMSTNEVDVVAFENLLQFFGAAFVDYDFLLTDTIENAKDFIAKEIFFPQAMYTVPRNARSSVRYLSPPLSIEQLPTIDETNITNILKVRQRRSTDKNFYNSILHKYGKSKLSGDFLAINQLISGDAVAKIPLGKKQLNIESEGLTRTSISKVAIDSAASRMLDRYSGAATYVDGIELTAKDGMRLEVGDVVFFGGAGTKLSDLNTGDRNVPVKKYEIVNMQFNLKTFTPKINILDTGFSLVGLYGVFSPSSYVGSQSTTTKLCLETFLDVGEVDFERQKWEPFIGANIRIRLEDYTFDESSVITGLDPQSNECILISPALSTTAPAGAIIELDLFDNLDDASEITADLKLRFTFTMDTALITTVTSTTVFDIDDTTGFFIGALVRVHSDDYTDDSEDNLVIEDITGSTITLSEPLSFTPLTGYVIDVLSYEDQDGYRLL